MDIDKVDNKVKEKLQTFRSKIKMNMGRDYHGNPE